MEWTPFAGLTALDENDPITIDGASFLIRNPRITDHLLQVGAVTHRHDAHPAAPVPHVALSGAVLATGGSLQASASYALTYTLVDKYGGETTAAAPVVLETNPPLPEPSFSPSAAVVYGSGIMPAGAYYYAITYTDGEGGETMIGPATFVYIDPGFASASVNLSGLATQLPTGPGAAWRLWRSYEGADWHLVTQGTADTFTDGGFDPPDNPALPPLENTTGDTNAIQITIPTVGAEPAIASATAIRVYLASDTGFVDPCFYTQVPAASAGASITITSDTVTEGNPPHVSLAIPGAALIDPDTDMLDWHWKRPVATHTILPSGAQGDVRLAIDTGHLWGVLGLSAASSADWTDLTALGGGGGASGAPDSDVRLVASADTGGSAFAQGEIELVGSGAASTQLTDLGGGSARITITVPTVVGPIGPTGPAGASGAPGPAGASGAPGPAGPAGSAANFVASAGTASALVGPFLGFAASGGASVQLIQSGGSAIVMISASGVQGPAGPAGGQGPQGPAGAVVGVGGSAVTPLIDPASYVEFVGSGGATVGVTNLGGGSARVSVTAPGTGGGISGIEVAGSGGVGAFGPESYVEFAGSGGTGVAVQDMGGGSARVLVSAPPSSGGGSTAVPIIAASAGASAVNPDYYTEYAASGGIDIAVQNLGGGSARVLAGMAYTTQPQFPGLISPMHPLNFTVSAAGGSLRMHLVRVVMPITGFLHDLSFFGVSASGHAIGAVFDTGDTSPGHYAKLWDSGSQANTNTNTWQVLGDPALPVQAGQQLILALVLDNGTAQLRFPIATTSSNQAQLPANFIPAPGGALPKLSGADQLASFAIPASILESAFSTSLGAMMPLLIARVDVV